MQREAEQRVREMQSRARLVGENELINPLPTKNFFTPECSTSENKNPLSSLFGNIDNDKLIILALLWILWNERSDPKLLLALLYLLL